jgi:hypothetical protein
MKTYKGVDVIDTGFLGLGTNWRLVVSFTARPLYPRRNSPGFPLDIRLCGPQSPSGRREEDKILAPIGTQLRPIGRPARS